MKTKAALSSYFKGDPERRALLRDIERFESELKASSYSSKGTIRSYRNGALSLVLFLLRKEKTSPRWTRRLDLLSGSRLWLEVPGERERCPRQAPRCSSPEHGRTCSIKPGKRPSGPSRFPPVVRNVDGPMKLPPALSSLPQALEEAMEVSTLSQTTRPVYHRALRDFLIYLVETEGITDLLDVTREVITAYRLHLQTKTTKKGTSYSLSTQSGVSPVFDSSLDGWSKRESSSPTPRFIFPIRGIRKGFRGRSSPRSSRSSLRVFP